MVGNGPHSVEAVCKPVGSTYNQSKGESILTLTPHQRIVLQALKDFGSSDDVALSIYVHHVADESLSSSGVRSRRAELVRKGLAEVVGTKRLKSGRTAAIHGITPAGKRVLRAGRKVARNV